MSTLSRDIHELMRCRGLQELLDTARRNLRSPLILADLTFHVLAMTQEPHMDDPRWSEISRDRAVPVDIVDMELYQSSLRGEMPVVSTDPAGLPVVRCAVGMDGRLLGYLLSPCYSGPPVQEHLDLIHVLSDLCALRMQKDLHYAQYPENMVEFFISDLLNGTITDEQRILDRCRYFGWMLKWPYRVLSIRPRRGGEQLELQRQRDALQARFPEATAFLYGEEIKFLIHVVDRSTQDAMIMAEVGAWLGEQGLVAGVSQTANHLRILSDRHTQAVKALEMGILLKGAGPLFYYDNYAVYHCLELCASQITLPQLCHSAVIKLESYDRKHGTELLGTLHAYLSCHSNLSEAAAALYIHRNTLRGRLDKINDLIHVDFSDAETVFHLMFSYRILEYYGATFLRDSYENWVERAPVLRHP